MRLAGIAYFCMVWFLESLWVWNARVVKYVSPVGLLCLQIHPSPGELVEYKIDLVDLGTILYLSECSIDFL